MLDEGVRVRELNAEDLDWHKRTGVPPYVAKVCVDVTIRRVSDGVERKHIDESGFGQHTGESVDDVLDAVSYMWRHGNYGCDCNRYLMFQRAADEDESGIVCGHGKYTVVAPAWLTGETR